MALLASLMETEEGLGPALTELSAVHEVIHAPSLAALLRLIHERPVAGVFLSGGEKNGPVTNALRFIESAYPRLVVVATTAPRPEPSVLLEIGRRRAVRFLTWGEVRASPDLVSQEMAIGIRRGLMGQILGPLSRMVSPWHVALALKAIDEHHRGWSAEEFSRAVGISRPALSVRLRSVGLPSTGRFLMWIRFFHAAWWLQDPGRTGESVSKQLEYSHPSGFRRAVRNGLQILPSDLARIDAVSHVWMRFLTDCTFRGRPGRGAPWTPHHQGPFREGSSALY